MGRTRQNWTAAPWRDVEHLQCAMTIPETADCATFAFRAPSGGWFDDQPGHFLTLELPVPGRPLLRTCTISSRPSRPLSISVTVKAQPGSAGSRRMQDNLKPGMRIKAHGPSGDFSFHRHPAPKYLFISSGSGITPMMSMPTWAWGGRRDAEITFIHAAPKPSDIVFCQRLAGFAARVPGLPPRFSVEEGEPFSVWPGCKGRLNQIMLGPMAPDYLDRKVFRCGRPLVCLGGQKRFDRWDRDDPCRGQTRRVEHPVQRQLRSVRNLQGAESFRRGRDDPQWRHLGRRDRIRDDPCLLLAPAVQRGDGPVTCRKPARWRYVADFGTALKRA